MRKRKTLPKPLLELRKRLNSREEAVREPAYQEALALPPEALLQLVSLPARRAHVYVRIQEVLGACGCLWVLVCLITAVAQFIYHVAFAQWDALLFLFIPIFIIAMNKATAPNQLNNLLSRAILAQDDARFVAPALLFYPHLYSRNYPQLHDDMRQTLLRLMPLLMPDNMEAWTPAHRAALRQQAFEYENGYWHDLEMMCCVLQTLTRVGDAADIPPARKLAGMTPQQITAKISPYVLAADRKDLCQTIRASTPIDPEIHGQFDPENEVVLQDARYKQWCSQRAQEIHAFANQCLTALTERSGQQQQSEVLLRASQEASAAQSQILLRPQYATKSETPPEELLRAEVES